MPVILTPDPTIGQPIDQSGLLYYSTVTTYPGIAAISTTDIAFMTLIQVVINGNLEYWQFNAGLPPEDANNINADDGGGYWHRVGGFGTSLMAAARVTRAALQTLTHSTTTAIIFDTSRFNSGEWEAVTHPSRITAIVDGVYDLSGSVSFDTNATSYRRLALRVNGTDDVAVSQINAVAAAVPTNMAVSSIYKLIAGDYVELTAFQFSGGNLDVLKVNKYSPELSAVRLSSLTPLESDPTTQ